MKLIDMLKETGRPFEAPNCGRNDLPDLFMSMGLKTGVEVGVYKGSFTRELLKAGLNVYGVDPWKAYGDYSKDKKYGEKFQERQDFLYEHTQRYLKKYLENGQCKLIRKTSMEGVDNFEDESIDFVYIDGHHGFKYIAEDIWEWSKKVKKGGIISGHDYAMNEKDMRDPYVMHVKYVVDAYVKALGIKNFYVLGRRDKLPEEVRDRTRSWMWIKQ